MSMTPRERCLLHHPAQVEKLRSYYDDLKMKRVVYGRDKRAKLMREALASIAKAEKRLFESET